MKPNDHHAPGTALLPAVLLLPLLMLMLAAPRAALSQTIGLAPATVANSAFAQPVTLSVLAQQRGGTDIVVNDMQLSGAVTGNSAINVASGTNTIGTGAFSGASGLPIVIQNSGTNVLIQNAVILNLQVR